MDGGESNERDDLIREAFGGHVIIRGNLMQKKLI